MKVKRDTVHCESAEGEPVPVLLWRKPRCTTTAQNLSGALQSGTEVRIMNRRTVDGFEYYEVKARQGGRMQRGWVYKNMLKGKQD